MMLACHGAHNRVCTCVSVCVYVCGCVCGCVVRVYSAQRVASDKTVSLTRSQRVATRAIEYLVKVLRKCGIVEDFDLSSVGARMAAESRKSKSTFDSCVPDGLLFRKRATLGQLMNLRTSSRTDLAKALLKPSSITDATTEVLERFRDVCVKAMQGGMHAIAGVDGCVAL